MNFICEECGKKDTLFRITIKDGKYFNSGKEILCCDIPMKHIPVDGAFNFTLGKFSGLSSGEKRKILKERSTKHYNEQIHDSKREQDLSHIKK